MKLLLIALDTNQARASDVRLYLADRHTQPAAAIEIVDVDESDEDTFTVAACAAIEHLEAEIRNQGREPR